MAKGFGGGGIGGFIGSNFGLGAMSGATGSFGSKSTSVHQGAFPVKIPQYSTAKPGNPYLGNFSRQQDLARKGFSVDYSGTAGGFSNPVGNAVSSYVSAMARGPVSGGYGMSNSMGSYSSSRSLYGKQGSYCSAC